MSDPELSFDAEDLDQLKDLRQNVNISLHELKEVSRLSLWDRVRPQDLEDYHSLSQRISQLEKKKWPKLAKRWLKWMMLCTQLYQKSLDLKIKTPQEAELLDLITKLTQSGTPRAKHLLNYNISEIEKDTQEVLMLLNWMQSPDTLFDQAFLNWKKFKRNLTTLRKQTYYKNLFPNEALSLDNYLDLSSAQLTPQTLKTYLKDIQKKSQDLDLFKQKIKEAQQWLLERQTELQIPQHQTLHEKLGEQLKNLINTPTEQHHQGYLNLISDFKHKWQEQQANRFDLLDQQPAISPEKLKQVLKTSWKAKP
jgi:hypothetical protein